MALPPRMKFGIFLAPFHELGEDPTVCLERDLELLQWLDYLDFDEAWIGEHHSAGWEIIASPEIFIGIAAERTKHIKLGTGVLSLPYHHPLMVANRMILLDHLTRGRVMMGVGPGALTTDALMLGIEPTTQRPRMEEAMEVILRLFNETEPITVESDWFTLRDARAHLRPYTQPHPPIAVAAAQTPSGMVTAGRFGASVLSFARPRVSEATLADFWQIAENTASQYGQTMDRHEWRIVMHVHLAETREQAIEEARLRSGDYRHNYFETTLGQPVTFDVPNHEIIDHMAAEQIWCVGTPDDLIAAIHQADEQSGGFGGLLIQATEWATRDQVRRSYELIARYVKPHFQGSLVNLRSSQSDAERNAASTRALQEVAFAQARADYRERSGGADSPFTRDIGR